MAKALNLELKPFAKLISGSFENNPHFGTRKTVLVFFNNCAGLSAAWLNRFAGKECNTTVKVLAGSTI